MSTTFQLNADGFTKQALQICGLLRLGGTVQPAMLADARDLLSVMLKTLQARGVTLTQMVRRTLTLSSGTSSYALGTDVIDVDETSTLIRSGETNETFVEKMVYSEYRTISNKDTQGTPTRVYVEKLSSVSVYFWDAPDGTYTWNYRALTLLPDMSNGSSTPELTQRWMGALLWRFAYWLANAFNLSPDKCARLKTEADVMEQDVLGQDNERGPMELMLPHSPYGGR